jgi:hypothetical protein
MNKAYRIFRFLLVSSALLMLPLTLKSQVDPMQDVCTAKYLVDSMSVDNYTFKVYEERSHDVFAACLEVVKAGVVVYRKVEDNGDFALGQKAEPENGIPGIDPGTDVTGDGHPAMLVSYFSGGAHCCMNMDIFELEPQFKLLQSLDAGNSDVSHFELDKSKGGYYFVGHEQIFAYWYTSFAESPLPVVILKPVFDAKGNLSYHLDWKRMQKSAPSDAVWKDDLKQAHEAFAEDAAFGGYLVGSGLWTPMLDLIYSGQSEWAWKVVDATWPAKKSGKDAFEGDLCAQLAQSPFWKDLEPTLKNPPPACAKALSGHPPVTHPK